MIRLRRISFLKGNFSLVKGAPRSFLVGTLFSEAFTNGWTIMKPTSTCITFRHLSCGFSDGKNVYTCFRCDFTLCVGCVKAVGGEDALATATSAASVTAAFDEASISDTKMGGNGLKISVNVRTWHHPKAGPRLGVYFFRFCCATDLGCLAGKLPTCGPPLSGAQYKSYFTSSQYSFIFPPHRRPS